MAHYQLAEVTEYGKPTLSLVVGKMCQLVHAGTADQKIRDLAEAIIRSLPSGDYTDECFAVYDWMCANFRYALDPRNVEYVRWPQGQFDAVSPNDPRQRMQEDCDGHAVFSASLLQSIGHKCAFALASFDGQMAPSHVFTVVSTRGNGLMAIDSVARNDTQRMLASCTSLTFVDCELGAEAPAAALQGLAEVPFQGWGGWARLNGVAP